MALIVRWFILRPTWTESHAIQEHQIGELVIINRGRPLDARPGAVDARQYEVSDMGEDGAINQTVWVDHSRSDGARRLTERALRALRPPVDLNRGRLDARTWLMVALQRWATEGARADELADIVDCALEAHVEGWPLPHS
jgi:hypothetical protein